MDAINSKTNLVKESGDAKVQELICKCEALAEQVHGLELNESICMCMLVILLRQATC